MRQKQRIRRQSAVCLPLRDSQRLVVVRIVLLINTCLVYTPLVRDTCGYAFSLSVLSQCPRPVPCFFTNSLRLQQCEIRLTAARNNNGSLMVDYGL